MKGLLESLEKIKQMTSKWSKILILSLLTIFLFLAIRSFTPQQKPIIHENLVYEKKGFDLFDEMSFLKGEKELHVLQMRALKGELEKEISLFENIASAKIIFEFQESVFPETAKPKASLLLTLKPDGHLTCSQLKAISSHISGAVRGLEPNQIAISDTSGKFYQGFEGIGFAPFTKTALEEDLKLKLEKILEKLAGENHCHLTLNANLEEKTLGLSLLMTQPKETFSEEIFKQQVSNLLPLFTLNFQSHTLAFPQETVVKEKPFSFFSLPIVLLVCVLLLSITALMIFSSRFFQKKQSYPEKDSQEVEDISSMMKKVNFTTLSSLIQEQPPSTIALMLSYLDKERQDALLSKLPQEIHDEVLFYLLQRGDV